jgi:succinyl-CoA synthetase beta subunit
LKILLDDKRIKVVLINIFGGITRCDEVARGLLTVFEKKKMNVPVVIRLAGTNADEALALLKTSGFIVAGNIVEAVKNAVKLSKGKKA